MSDEAERQSEQRTGMVTNYMTFEEARDYLGVVRSAVYDAANRGDLVRVKVLGKTVLTRASVEAYRPRQNKRRGAADKPTTDKATK
jgi:hypothetical protein